ncbi:4-(cytidine 5'-diphospho)-2-C-methyl-D-erythritol kinase [bacterium]|nr:4-(cytidine 5'-diphospho)-2-C-methyl-D-erythritol kinase [bacterium]
MAGAGPRAFRRCVAGPDRHRRRRQRGHRRTGRTEPAAGRPGSRLRRRRRRAPARHRSAVGATGAGRRGVGVGRGAPRRRDDRGRPRRRSAGGALVPGERGRRRLGTRGLADVAGRPLASLAGAGDAGPPPAPTFPGPAVGAPAREPDGARSRAERTSVTTPSTVRRQVRLRAPAKVNLHLEVLRRRHDGYHEIETILQAVDLHDELKVTLSAARMAGTPTVDLLVRPDGAVPDDETNLCWAAAELFCRRLGVGGELRIELDKAIPTGAGLGGGSSDAMAVLMACNHLYDAGLDLDELEDMGAELGSDVPFFARGGTQLARGRGTDLTPLPQLPRVWFLIVKPAFEVATAGAYEALKMGLTVRSPAANLRVIKSLLATFPTRPWFGYNRLEDVVVPQHPDLGRLLLRLREVSPLAMMTGSGAAIFGVFRDRDRIRDIVEEFEEARVFTHSVESLSRGVQLQEG